QVVCPRTRSTVPKFPVSGFQDYLGRRVQATGAPLSWEPGDHGTRGWRWLSFPSPSSCRSGTTTRRTARSATAASPAARRSAAASWRSRLVLTRLTRTAFRDIAHLLRPQHLRQLRSILDDPEASPNDRYVARDLLQNACIAAGGILPMCQDTGTAIVMG